MNFVHICMDEGLQHWYMVPDPDNLGCTSDVWISCAMMAYFHYHFVEVNQQPRHHFDYLILLAVMRAFGNF
jgi:hypothetical protein